ncbi:MAG: hypothetical protein K1X57_22270 [Gemmataceae bacterium]|nr:hypothetical protein [Gemmataceae bacterium]
MQNFETLVHPEMGGKQGFTVEFIGKSGDVISVMLRQDEDSMLNRVNAVEKARELLGEVASLEGGEAEPGSEAYEQAVHRRSARSLGDAEVMEEQLDAGLYDSFPASDPVSITITTVTGCHKPPSNAH